MGIFSKTKDYLKERLGKTRSKISTSLSSVLSLGRKIDDELLDELEETLIRDDIGVETTDKLITELREAYRAIDARIGVERGVLHHAVVAVGRHVEPVEGELDRFVACGLDGPEEQQPRERIDDDK